MTKKLFVLVTIFCVLISCSLDRDNPLDPHNSGVTAPPNVTGIFVNIIGNYELQITWNALSNEDADGYYIYRCMSYNGYYERIDNIDVDDFVYTDTNSVDVMNNFYWYKMSAYREVNGAELEGMRSDPHTWGSK